MNSEEIAKLAEVSRSTVSRVVNDYDNVPEKTRIKVQRIIDKFGYTPNASARTLAGKANDIIGLFIADIDITESSDQWLGANSPYNAELIAKVIRSCKKRGYTVLVNTISSIEEIPKMETFFRNRLLYGGIFIGFPYKMKAIADMAEKDFNISFVDQFTEEDDLFHKVKTVNNDNITGGYMATKHLIDLGHEKIAHFTGDNRLSSIEREKGYKKALIEAGIDVDPSLILKGEYREEIAYKKAKNLLEKKDVTAIFSGNDIMALGIIKAANDLGMSIPNDLSIVGFDHLKYTNWTNLGLTTVEIPIDDVSEKGVDQLFNGKTSDHRLSKPQLIEKKSTIKNKK